MRYKTLEYLTLGEEEKGIALLDAQLRTLQTQLAGDADLISTVSAISFLKESLNHVTMVLKNFPLSENSKKTLENTLSLELDHMGIMDNSLKNEYKKIGKYLVMIPTETTFFDKDYTDRGFREMTFEKIKNKGEISDAMLEKYILPLPIGKGNALGWVLWRTMDSTYGRQYEKMAELAAIRTSVVEALK